MIFFCSIFIFRKKKLSSFFSDLLFVGGRERGVERLIDEEQIRELKILLGSSNNNYGYNNNYNENNNFDNQISDATEFQNFNTIEISILMVRISLSRRKKIKIIMTKT